MKQTLKKTARRILGNSRYDNLFYSLHHRRLVAALGLPSGKAVGEDVFLARWHRLSHHVDRYSYRLYSNYCGPTPNIVPHDLLHNTIEPALNPPELWDEYEDKNNFARYVGADILPQTVAFRQAGGNITFNYPLPTGVPSARPTTHYPLILKPSIGTSCGNSIMRFDRVGENYLSADGTVLTSDFLSSYGTDWVLQEAVTQHPDLQRLCSTAVCTVRLVVYRSMVDGAAHVTAAVLRVGQQGHVVDNIVAGGRFLGVDIKDGSINTPFIARFGSRSDTWNGIRIGEGQYKVPCWDSVVSLAHHVAASITPHHLLALDVTVTDKEKPMLIEYNIGGFSSYLFHFAGQTVFGPYTEEVIDYCLSQRVQSRR